MHALLHTDGANIIQSVFDDAFLLVLFALLCPTRKVLDIKISFFREGVVSLSYHLLSSIAFHQISRSRCSSEQPEVVDVHPRQSARAAFFDDTFAALRRFLFLFLFLVVVFVGVSQIFFFFFLFKEEFLFLFLFLFFFVERHREEIAAQFAVFFQSLSSLHLVVVE